MSDPLQSEVPLFHPSRRPFRFTVLFFASLLTFGSYFAYDIIGAIAPSLIEELGAERGTIGGFYTAYSVAAIIALLIGGFMIDRLGTRISSLVFSILVVIGAAVVAFAPSINMVFVGRFIFGAGAEPLVVAQSAILARWFKGKELALAFGIGLTVSRLGTLFSFNMGELLASHFGGFRYPLYAAVGFCLISIAGNIAYIFLDRRGEAILELEETSAEDKIVVSDIKHFGASYWYVTMLCVTFYSAVFPFTALSTDMFVDKWGVPRVAEATGGFLYQAFNNLLHMFSTAGGLTSIIIFASMVCAPFAGYLVDRYGRRATVMIVGSLVLIPAHLTMGLSEVYPAYPMLALGVAFVLVPAAMWPAIPLIVKKEHIGTAFGLMTVIQNIGLGAFPAFNGILRDITQEYTASMVMFAALGVVGLVFAVLLKRADARAGGILEAPGS
ncbi:MAG: MFS transporter [Acidobacteria bacterium]|nr:MFS transporter [Acidobacteriota bacterium]